MQSFFVQAAFLLPILHSLLSDPRDPVVTPEGACLPQCVILSPTRELTSQIWSEARKFALNSILKCCVVYGGTSTYHQTQSIMVSFLLFSCHAAIASFECGLSDIWTSLCLNLQRGCHVLVATPGRMHDLVERGRLSFDDVRFVVLDEADRMLDMGFLSSIEKMMSHSSMQATVSARSCVLQSCSFNFSMYGCFSTTASYKRF